MTLSFKNGENLEAFQKFIEKVYALPDDRLYSIWDILVQEQRFAMRALKGIRKGNIDKLKNNLLICFAWLMAIANRLHINVENETWKRFPYACSYCGRRPCACKKIRPSERPKQKINSKFRPKSLGEFQIMFNEIYPAKYRTLADSGVHFAEEIGEVSEAIHNYLGQHRQYQFDNVGLEIADVVSCIFGVASSAKINMAEELKELFSENCHICHRAPCICGFSDVVQIET